MEETIKRPPFPVDFEERVYRELFAGQKYFIWRPTEAFEPYLDERPIAGWETYCTACEARGFLPKKGHKIKGVKTCPHCGAAVNSVRYDQKLYSTREMMWLQRGYGTDVWLYLFTATCEYSIEDGYAVSLNVERIWNFDHNTPREWTERTYWEDDAAHYGWYPLKRVREPRGVSGPYMMQPDWDTLAGSCVQYASLDKVWEYFGCIQTSYDGEMGGAVNYLRRFVRYPLAMEYLYKSGFENLVMDACGVNHGVIDRVVNWRAKKPERIFKKGGLNKAELRALRGESAQKIETYLQLRKYGEKPDGVLIDFVRPYIETDGLDGLLEAHPELGRDLRRTLKYLRHMARQKIGTFSDYRDYMRDLRALREAGLCEQIGQELLYPSAFQRVHADKAHVVARLQRKARGGGMKWKWRMRRHEAAWLRWKWGGMCIRPIDSEEDIITEGEQNHNCVGSHYVKKHLNRGCCILVLRRADAPQDSWYTVELDESTLTVVQCRAQYNRAGSAQDAADKDAFIQRWLMRIRRLREEQTNDRRCA